MTGRKKVGGIVAGSSSLGSGMPARSLHVLSAMGAWARGLENSMGEAQGWAAMQDDESGQQPQLSCRQLCGILTPSLDVQRASPPAKEGFMEKCSPDLTCWQSISAEAELQSLPGQREPCSASSTSHPAELSVLGAHLRLRRTAMWGTRRKELVPGHSPHTLSPGDALLLHISPESADLVRG